MKTFRLTCIFCLFLLKAGAQDHISPYQVKIAGSAYHQFRLDSAGNTFVFGSFDHVGGAYYGRLVKLDQTGAPIQTFAKLYADGTITDLVLQTDGKILICGTFSKINANTVGSVVRLNADGSIDNSFTTSLEGVSKMEIQSTGKIIVSTDGVLARLNANGSIDNTFAFQNYIFTGAEFAIGPDDAIYFTNYNAIFKLTANGADDNSFASLPVGYAGQQWGGQVATLRVQTNGKVLVGGYFTHYNGIAKHGIARLNTDGSLDNTFSSPLTEGGASSIIVRPNGNILIAGGNLATANNSHLQVAELTTAGVLHRPIATTYTNSVSSLLLDKNDKITIGGEFESVNGVNRYGAARFNSNYTLDMTFAPVITWNNSNGRKLVVDNQMRATIFGDYQYRGIYHNQTIVPGKALRVTSAGVHDPGFNPFFATSYATVYSEYIQSDNKIILGGAFGGNSWELIRVNPDGTKDNTFNTGTGPTNETYGGVVYAIEKVSNRILIGGYFTGYSGTPTQSLAAIDVNGALVQAFTGLPAQSQVSKIKAQSDGKIVVLGSFPFPGSTKSLLRFNSNGTLDQTFHSPSFYGWPAAMTVDSLDNIYITGQNLNPDGSYVSCLAKFDPDGYLDGDFFTGQNFGGEWPYIVSITVLPHARIAVGGYFEKVGANQLPGFAILGLDGHLASTEQFFGRESRTVNMYYRNGHLFLAGRFTKTDYTDAYGVARIMILPASPPSAPSHLQVAMSTPGNLSITWNDNSDNENGFVVERAIDNLTTFTTIGTVGADVTQFNDQIAANSYRAYRVRAFNDEGNSAYTNIDSLKWAPAPAGTLTLTIPTPSSTTVNLSWSGTVQYHIGFIIERKTGDGSFVALDTVAKTTTSFASTIVRDVQYQYRVKAYNDRGIVSSTNVSVKWAPIPQGTITLTAPTPTSTQANLSWSGTIQYHDGFIIDRSVNNGAYVAQDTVSKTTNSFQQPIELGVLYKYRVKAYNANGSLMSAVVNVQYLLIPQGTLTLIVPAPTTNQANLAWAASVTNHTGFIIERKKVTDATYTALDTVPTTTNTFASTIEPFVQYAFRVKAYNSSGALTSEVVSVAWNPAPAGQIQVSVEAGAPGEANLSWTSSVIHHVGFIIQRSLQSGTGYVALDTVSKSATTFTDQTDEDVKSYYRILAYNSAGTIASNEVVMLVTGVESYSNNVFRVFPNPSTGLVTAELIEPGSADLSGFTLTDLAGRHVVVPSVNGGQSVDFDLTHLPTGLYILKLKDKGRVLTSKISKR